MTSAAAALWWTPSARAELAWAKRYLRFVAPEPREGRPPDRRTFATLSVEETSACDDDPMTKVIDPEVPNLEVAARVLALLRSWA